jgi:predicted nucleotidyltransferase
MIANKFRAKATFMNRNQTLVLLTEHKSELMHRYGVTQLALFGSTVRNAAHPGSDVDVLVAFDALSRRNAILASSFTWKICLAARGI